MTPQRPSYGSVESHGAPICPRCRTRIDARRGPTTFCHSCGAPLPQMQAASGGGSSAVVWVVGIVAVFAIMGGCFVAFLLLRAPVAEPKSLPPTTTITVFSDTPSASASASASAAPSATVAAPLTAAELDVLEGNYQCSMDDTPAFPCRISNDFLEKLGGSQRFKGPVSKRPDGGFGFSGTFFCPFGDCTHPVACTFTRTSAGHYSCKFGPNSVPGGGPGGEHVVLTKTR